LVGGKHGAAVGPDDFGKLAHPRGWRAGGYRIRLDPARAWLGGRSLPAAWLPLTPALSTLRRFGLGQENLM
jgi:hypothetical protein